MGVEFCDGGGDEREDVAGLLSAGFDDGEQGFCEPASFDALGVEAEFAPDDCGSQESFADVVGRFGSLVVEERPQSFAVLQQFLAGSGAHGGPTRFRPGSVRS